MDPRPLRWLRITLPMAAGVDSMQSFEYLQLLSEVERRGREVGEFTWLRPLGVLTRRPCKQSLTIFCVRDHSRDGGALTT